MKQLSFLLYGLLIGQFHTSMYAMLHTHTREGFHPLTTFLAYRESIRERGSQVLLSSGTRKGIARFGFVIKKVQSLDRGYNKLITVSCAAFALFGAYYLTRVASLYLRHKLLIGRITKDRDHRQLVEQKIIRHFPAHASTKASGSIIADFLDYQKQIDTATRQTQAHYSSERRYCLKDSLRKAHYFIMLAVLIASLILFSIVASLHLIAFYSSLGHLAGSCITIPLYGTKETADTLSLLVYHDYDKFLFVTATLLSIKYLTIIGTALLPAHFYRKMQMP